MKIIEFIFTFIGQIFDELLKFNEFVAFFVKNLFPVSYRENRAQDIFIEAFVEVIKDEELFKVEDLDEIRQLYNYLERLQNRHTEQAFEVISQFLKNHHDVRDRVISLARRSQTRQIESSDFGSLNPKNQKPILSNTFGRLTRELNQLEKRLLDEKLNNKPSN